jgi:quercetin dioxygenase-like cupin family protein
MDTNASFKREKTPVTVPSIIFDLPVLIANMKKSYTWSKGELNAKILLKSPEKQIVLAVLHEGTEVSSFQSNDSITVQIIEGRLRFHTRKESKNLNEGQLLTLHDKVKYSMSTLEETAFLLTIANGTINPSKN